jgi:hypothetical protein
MCSTRCRVRLNRHPGLCPKRPGHPAAELLRDISLSFYAQLTAYIDLFPERDEAIRAGTLSLEHPRRRDVISNEARIDANREFARRVFELAAWQRNGNGWRGIGSNAREAPTQIPHSQAGSG